MSQDLAGLATDLEGFFARRVPLRWDAEDLTQETFVRALAHWGQAREPDAPRAWMYAIARNVLRDHYAASASRPEPAELGDEPAAEALSPEWRAAVRGAVREGFHALPREQREVLLLRLMGDLSFAHIAGRVGVPEATARTRAFHGLRRLRATVALHLRQEGLLVECGEVRDGLLKRGFGLAPERVREEVGRHLQTCEACRREALLIGEMLQGLASPEGPPVQIGAWAMHDVEGNATSYWVEERLNGGSQSEEEWGVNSSHHPDQWSFFDPEGRRLEEIRRWKYEDGWRWGMRYRLNEPWLPRQRLRVVGTYPERLRVQAAGDRWVHEWSEVPTSGGAELLCRRAFQLPPAVRATSCDPEPDDRVQDGRLLTWTRVARPGEELHFRIAFQHAVA